MSAGPESPGSDASQEALELPGLARAAARKAQKAAHRSAEVLQELAEVDPVARVLVDVPLAHLDRPFDYSVTAAQADAAVPGARVKVRFAGKEVDGFIVARVAESEHPGRLQTLRRVVSGEPVLAPEIERLTAAVAARYAGTRSDVLRLAIPPRHATTEKLPSSPAQPIDVEPAPWAGYEPDLVSDLAGGGSPRGVVAVLPGDDPAAILVEAVIATARSGRGAVVCVPDQRDLDRLDAALRSRVGEGRHVVLNAQAGPADRYAAFLAVSRGACRVVIGTRAAAYAPVHDLGLVAIWDDGDDLYAEPRAPYSHTREVLLIRAEQTGAAALLVAHARSVEAEYLLRTGWATEVSAPRETIRERVSAAVSGDSWHELERDAAARSARLPGQAHALLREALATGPVLVQTPRAGYATRLACDRCRTPAACARCAGPLQIVSPTSPPTCTWCATAWPQWVCPVCEGRGLRAPVVGDRRTAEEIGRSFPGVRVRTSSGDRVIATVPDEPAIVVATPGAEPVAEGGYAAVLLMDTWLLLARDDLRASEEALRRWVNAASLVRHGGKVLAVGEPSNPALQALVRWDPAGFARREMGERQSAHLPPSSRLATVTGPLDDVEPALESLRLPAGAEVLGPVPADDEAVRYVVRVPRRIGAELSSALGDLQRGRSARKLPHLRVRVDPAQLE